MQTAPYDYADLMEDIARCDSLIQLKIFSLGTVARRAALPQPWRNAVETGLAQRLSVVEARLTGRVAA